jgi:hypothetical protein
VHSHNRDLASDEAPSGLISPELICGAKTTQVADVVAPSRHRFDGKTTARQSNSCSQIALLACFPKSGMTKAHPRMLFITGYRPKSKKLKTTK